jgi:hypothetical protein
MMQSGIILLRYWTEMTDAGMPMPAIVLRMPMPSYGGARDNVGPLDLAAVRARVRQAAKSTAAVRAGLVSLFYAF